MPTKSMFVCPAFCNWFHSTARQQPGEPVIESPSGMMRTGSAAVCAALGAAMAGDARVRGASRAAGRPRSGMIGKREPSRREMRVLRMMFPSPSEMGALPGNMPPLSLTRQDKCGEWPNALVAKGS